MRLECKQHVKLNSLKIVAVYVKFHVFSDVAILKYSLTFREAEIKIARRRPIYNFVS